MFWRAIDWQRPWLAPYRALGEAARRHLDAGATVAAALNDLAAKAPPSLRAGPLRFVPHETLSRGEAYEAFIHRCACVPTRENVHDLLNGLVWLAWPAVKRRLNELQAVQIAQAGVGPTRGAVRDALTLFDENVALWQAPPALVDALEARDWHALFVGGRSAWREARTVLFGHALMEKLIRPRKAITAHVCVVPSNVDPASWLLDRLSVPWLAAKPFLPMPVLGVPGWWPPNEDEGFYDDAAVFRPARDARDGPAMRQSAP